MELDVEQLDRFLRWKKIALWIIFALICAGIVVAIAILLRQRAAERRRSFERDRVDG